MKTRNLLVSVAGILTILLALNIGQAYAEELKGSTGGSLNALNSGYAITRWPWNNGEIYPGQDAAVRACTTDPPHPEATHVVFRWNRPNGNHMDVGPVELTLSGDTWDGKPIWDAYDTETIDMPGDWGVQALFCDSEGKLKGPSTPYQIVKIKATSWHAIPELPLGTIASLLSLLGGMGVFTIVQRKKAIPRI